MCNGRLFTVTLHACPSCHKAQGEVQYPGDPRWTYDERAELARLIHEFADSLVLRPDIPMEVRDDR